MTSVIELATPRLVLRRWRADDRPEFARVNADARVMRHFPAPLDRAASDAFADRIEAGFAQRGWGLWALEAAAVAPFIGFVGITPVPASLPCAPAVEVGWRLAYEHWGRGYASEAGRAALYAGFAVVGLAEIVSFTALQNLRSRAVMGRLGMKEDGAAAFNHPALASGHALSRHCLCRIVRGDWVDSGVARLYQSSPCPA